ncbi:MAG TPA: response regulator [Minicystis sp.]|nr:response regulator [Minicystis sp.]
MSNELRILVVEDDADLRESILSVLEEHYAVDGAHDGEEALARLNAHGFDVVLLDLSMPRLDGTGFLVRLAEVGVDTPVIVTSAARDVRQRTTGLRVAAVLPKPFGMDALVAEIERVAAAQGKGTAGRPSATSMPA